MAAGADRGARAAAYVGKMRAEIAALAADGVVTAGNAFAPVLLVKGEVTAAELAGALLAGEDGTALRAALTALGYAPEEWCGLATLRADGVPLGAITLRTAVAALDPATLVTCDETAADAVRATYADELAEVADFGAAMLTPGLVAPVLGMRVLNLGGFAAALSDAREKQRMWAYLKQVPPLGEPL